MFPPFVRLLFVLGETLTLWLHRILLLMLSLLCCIFVTVNINWFTVIICGLVTVFIFSVLNYRLVIMLDNWGHNISESWIIGIVYCHPFFGLFYLLSISHFISINLLREKLEWWKAHWPRVQNWIWIMFWPLFSDTDSSFHFLILVSSSTKWVKIPLASIYWESVCIFLNSTMK